MLARCARERLQECRGPGAPAGPAPCPRTDQAGAVRAYTAVYFLEFPRVVCKHAGDRSQTFLRVPPGLTLRESASARAPSPGPGLLGPPRPVNLVGRGRQGAASRQPLPSGTRTPPTSSSRRFSLSLLSSPQMSTSFPLQIQERKGRVGRAGLEPPSPSRTTHSCPSLPTPAAPPSAPAASLKTAPLPVALRCRPCHFCSPWDFVGPGIGGW